MRAIVLGSAAGGGFPQWNCACPNCAAVRAGKFQGKRRTQTQVAVTVDGEWWFLLGASPDLRAQIESTPELQPQAGIFQSTKREAQSSTVRSSPIAGAILANADVDHVLGLLLLRELQPLRVHATASVRQILRENSMFRMLNRVPNQVDWADFQVGTTFSIFTPAGHHSGLRCRAIPLATHFPAYVAPEYHRKLRADEASLGLIIESGAEGSVSKRIAFLPAVPAIDEGLLAEIDACDVLLMDGTFWSDDELVRVQGSGQTAREMGHVPVQETLRRLEGVRHPRKIFVHINNTNPMLDESGKQHQAVRAAGWEIALDGMEI
jgi:pyrroloquinoline quinone biosynthesis protein B